MDQITSYSSLQSAVAGTLHRTGDDDIEDNAPLWIQMCEADLYDRLLLKDMESDESLTLTESVNYVALPSNFISEIALWLIEDSERDYLTKTNPSELPYYSTNGRPRFWAIDAGNIRFDYPADQAYSAKLRCFKKSNLSVSNTSNALLLARPDIYLYGTLMQSCLFSQDDNGAKKWGGFYETAIKNHQNKQSRHKDIALRTPFPIHARSNILTG